MNLLFAGGKFRGYLKKVRKAFETNAELMNFIVDSVNIFIARLKSVSLLITCYTTNIKTRNTGCGQTKR